MSRIPFTPKQRFEIFSRDGFACQYCGGQAPNVQLVVDHVVPVAHGGGNEESNLATACYPCNAGKADGAYPLARRMLEAWEKLRRITTNADAHYCRLYINQFARVFTAINEQAAFTAILSPHYTNWRDWRDNCDRWLADRFLGESGFYRSETELPLHHKEEIRALYNHLVDDSADSSEAN